MLNTWLCQLGLTRDSSTWAWGKLTGGIVLIATLGAETAEMHLGIPPKLFHLMQFAAAWITLLSAQKSSSGLPGGDEVGGSSVMTQVSKTVTGAAPTLKG